jgi:hypothetical protein
MTTRREFIKQAGITLASMMMARCQVSSGRQPNPSPTVPPSPTPGCAPFETASESPRERLRHCWKSLDWLQRQTMENLECGAQAASELEISHRAALDDLVDAGQVNAKVAEQAQFAFEEATYHVWRENALGCYIMEGGLGLYTRDSREQLGQRAALLARMADGEELAPETVAQAQAVIERDLAFLGSTHGGWTEPANWPTDRPDFDELDLEITPEARAAAAFLTELLTAQ